MAADIVHAAWGWEAKCALDTLISLVGKGKIMDQTAGNKLGGRIEVLLGAWDEGSRC